MIIIHPCGDGKKPKSCKGCKSGWEWIPAEVMKENRQIVEAAVLDITPKQRFYNLSA